MEAILFLVIFYGGIYLIGAIFSAIGKWNDNRKSNIRDEVANEVLPKTNITTRLIKEYKNKLKSIGYGEKERYSWMYDLSQKYYRRQSYQELLGKCPECNNGNLKIRDGKYGKFLGCSRYPLCRYTKSLLLAKRQYKEQAQQEFMESFTFAYK